MSKTITISAVTKTRSRNDILGKSVEIPRAFLRSMIRILISNRSSIIAFRDSPALHHYHVAVGLQPNAYFVASIRPPVFSSRKHVNYFTIPDNTCKSSKAHNVANANRPHHSKNLTQRHGDAKTHLINSSPRDRGLAPLALRTYSLLGVCDRGGLVGFQVAFYGIEDSVYELSCFERREAPRYFESFVYHYGLGSVGFVEKLVDGEPEDVSVDNCHALDSPILGALFYQRIDLDEVRNRTERKIIGKVAGHVSHIIAKRQPIAGGQLVDWRPCNIVLKEHL